MDVGVETATERELLLAQYASLSKQIADARLRRAKLEPITVEHKRVFDRLQEISPRRPRRLRVGEAPVLAVEHIAERDALHELREDWDELLERVDNYSPFVTWEWWWPWLECYGDTCRANVIVLRDQQGKLQGGLPLALPRRGTDRARFLGYGCGPDPAYLSPPIADSEALTAILQAIGELPVRGLLWEQCPVDERLTEIFRAVGSAGWQTALHIRRHYVHGELPNTWEAYVAGVASKNRRSALRHQFERLTVAWGEPRLEVHREWNDETLALVERMADYSIQRRRYSDCRSRYEDKLFRHCLSRTASHFAERGWMRLMTIRVGEELSAALLGWAYRGTFFAYQIGTHPQHQELGLGHCVISHAIRSAIVEGLERFEMLGQSSQFKRSYFAGLTPAATVLFGPDHSEHWFDLGSGAFRQAVAARYREFRARFLTR